MKNLVENKQAPKRIAISVRTMVNGHSVDLEREINAYNIRIKKCCASCAYKGYINNARRICIKDNRKVKASHCCDQWQMSEGLKCACGYRR